MQQQEPNGNLRHGAAARNQVARCRACGSHLFPPPSLSNFSIRSLRLPAGVSVFSPHLAAPSSAEEFRLAWRGEAIAFLESGSGGVIVIVRGG